MRKAARMAPPASSAYVNDPESNPDTGSSNRQVWRLAWPTIISNLLFTTVGFMHIKIVAGLGTSAVAAVSTGHRVFFLVQAILMGVSVAATALISRAWGARNVSAAEGVAWTSLTLGVIVAATVSVPIVIFSAEVAGLFGLDPGTTRQAGAFIFWMAMFNVFSAVSMVLSTALRATGDVITPLWFLLASSLFNVLIGYSLAYGIGPLPALGVSGVALGGSIAASLVTVVFAVTWWRGWYQLRPPTELRIQRDTARQLAIIGLPSVVEQGVVQLAFLVFFALVAKYGTAPFAAYGIGMSLVSFPIVVGFGFGIATATLVGQQLGAGRPEQAIAAGWRSLRMALLAMAFISVFLLWNAEVLARFMIKDEEVVQLTVQFIYIIALCQPMMAVEFTLASALRGAGDTRYPLLITFLGIVLGRLLPALLFYKLGLSVGWIFGVMALDYGIKAVLLIRRFRAGQWVHINPAVSRA